MNVYKHLGLPQWHTAPVYWVYQALLLSNWPRATPNSTATTWSQWRVHLHSTYSTQAVNESVHTYETGGVEDVAARIRGFLLPWIHAKSSEHCAILAFYNQHIQNKSLLTSLNKQQFILT